MYADDTALQAAMTAAPAALTAATAAKESAVAAAEAMTDADEKAAALQVAETAYLRALVAYRQAFDGIVVNDQIKAAVLLTVGHLYAQTVKMLSRALRLQRCPMALITCCSPSRCTPDASRTPQPPRHAAGPRHDAGRTRPAHPRLD